MSFDITLLSIYLLGSTIFMIYICFRWSTQGFQNRAIKGFLFIMAIIGVLLNLKGFGVPLGL